LSGTRKEEEEEEDPGLHGEAQWEWKQNIKERVGQK
jgi:hypothetical protein